MREQLKIWSATCTVEEVGAGLGIMMGSALARLGREKALWLINEIWKKMCDETEKRYGINLNEFKGTENVD